MRQAVVTVLVGLAMLGAGAPAQAAGETASITKLTSFGCNEGDATFDWVMNGMAGTTYRVNLVVLANGQTVMNEEDEAFVGSASDNYATYFSDTYGPAVNAWPLPPNTIETIQMIMRLESDQSIVATGVLSFNCTTGLPPASSAPALSPIPLAGLGLLLVVGGVWMTRKRRARDGVVGVNALS